MPDLTGRVQHRTLRVPWKGDLLLVLQVEVRNLDTDFSPSETLWRDAKAEDLAHLPNLYNVNKET